MSKTITVENIKTGVRSPYTQEEWDKIKDKPEWKYAFKVVPTTEAKVPAEVKELEAKAEEKTASSTDTATDTKAEEKEDGKTAKKNDAKSEEGSGKK